MLRLRFWSNENARVNAILLSRIDFSWKRGAEIIKLVKVS
jgi:hypothetical protein